MNCGIDTEDDKVLCSDCLSKTTDCIEKANAFLGFRSGELCMFSNRLEFKTKNPKKDKIILFSDIQCTKITMKNLIQFTYKNGECDSFGFNNEATADKWNKILNELMCLQKPIIHNKTSKNNITSDTIQINQLNGIEQNSSNENLHCRICDAVIKQGTLCPKCLRSANQNLLTVSERKQRNENSDNKKSAIGCFGIILFIIGIVFLFFSKFMWCLSTITIGGILFFYGFIKKSNVCSACQRKGTMRKVNSKLVGTRDTTVKETRKIKHTKSGYSINSVNPDYYEYEVDVPATEYYYDVTYKCSVCKHAEIMRESMIQKD